MAYKNPEDAKAAKKAWYEKNKEARTKQIKNREKVIRSYVQGLKEGMSCIVCGEDEPVCLDFHHLDPNEKEVGLGAAWRKGWSLERLQKEIDKCVLVCSNCHRKLHAGIIKLPD